MSKTMLKNILGSKSFTINLPAKTADAESFATAFLDGEFVGYEALAPVGTDTAEPYNLVSVMIKNTAGLKTYLNLATKSTKSESDIYAALLGKTFNDVKADDIYILKMRQVS